MKIDSLVHNGPHHDSRTGIVRPTASDSRGYRWFGGVKTSVKRARCIAYAWRQHRKLGRPGVFMFTVTGSVFRATGRRPALHAAGKIVGFVTEAERKRGIVYLRQQGFDYFVEFRDVNATYALQFGIFNKELATTPVLGRRGQILRSNRVQ